MTTPKRKVVKRADLHFGSQIASTGYLSAGNIISPTTITVARDILQQLRVGPATDATAHS